MKHIIFSDIDGTLYDFSQKFHKDTLDDIKKAKELGIEFVIATGNGYFPQVAKVADLTGADYAITSNGASIFDIKNQEFILKETIPAELANKILQFANKHEIAANWWDEKNIYVNDYQVDRIKNVLQNVMQPKDGVQTSNEINSDIFKIEFYDEPNKVDEIEEFVNGLGLQVARMKPEHVEITHVGVSKGSGVKFMCEKLGVDPMHSMSIGDSANDLPMFRVTGHSYAMANGREHVHEVANHHTSSVEQNGLGRAIEDFIYREKI